jgi:hypothetical protein
MSNGISQDESNPFSEWSTHINKPVYSIDGEKLGLLRNTSSDYLIISGGVINLSRYFVPKSMAESAIKDGIKLSITTFEARTKYSYKKMKNFVSSLGLVPEDYIKHRRFYDRPPY